FSQPTFADLDHDGDVDLVVGEINGSLLYFENIGSAKIFSLAQQPPAANPFNGIDVGGYSSPTCPDLDGDADLDLVVGRLFDGLFYFENTGTATAPTFVQRTGTANPVNGVTGGFNSTPTFADVDGDGDLDLVVGDSFGHLSYFENTGSATSPA